MKKETVMKKRNLFYVLIACIMCLLFVLAGCDGNTGDNANGGNGDTGTYFTVTFDSRGGSAVESRRIHEGDLVVRPETPTKSGHIFTGWFQQDNTEWKFDTDRVNSDITLYAGWQISEQPPETDGNKILIAYFSCTNTTKSVAETIYGQIEGSDIYQITPAAPYTSADLNYNNSSCRANREQNDPNARPAITGSVESIEQYDVIFIGYPIWWGQAPKIIYTFLESYDYDFNGVTIIPFCTSGSSGIGTSATNLHGLAPNAIWKSGARISGNNVSALIAQMKEINGD